MPKCDQDHRDEELLELQCPTNTTTHTAPETKDHEQTNYALTQFILDSGSNTHLMWDHFVEYASADTSEYSSEDEHPN